MINIEIKNKNVLDILDKIRYTYTEKYQISDKCRSTGNPEDMMTYISDKYRDKIMGMGTSHEGHAELGHGYLLKHPVDGDQEYKNELLSFDNQMKELLGLSCSALTMAYPPGGYIEWHNNANAPSYNLVFTWSETGDGWFRYYDRVRKENVTMRDKAGWTLKAGYFGGYHDDQLVYHCAATECWRMTWSWMLGFDEEYWNDCLSVISEE